MDTKMEAVQESIKLALDAADAATDVTSEYNKVKNLGYKNCKYKRFCTR